jgi:MraZ protein
MALFLSKYLNKVDRKGRVSVPAQFRAQLAGQSFKGVVVYRSPKLRALDGFSMEQMEQLSARLNHFDLFSDDQDDLAATIFGGSVPLPFDGEGRITLPQDLAEFVGIDEQVAFVGLGAKFQIWEPAAYDAHEAEARERARGKALTLPPIGPAPTGSERRP